MREIDAKDLAGIEIRFVVIGTVEEAASFCAQFGDPKRCLADPDKVTYKAMGLDDFNLLKLFSDPDLRSRRRENKAAGFHQNWRATKLKNAAQLPGAAAIDANGVIRWLHRGMHPGDLPSMREMLLQARRV